MKWLLNVYNLEGIKTCPGDPCVVVLESMNACLLSVKQETQNLFDLKMDTYKFLG